MLSENKPTVADGRPARKETSKLMKATSDDIRHAYRLLLGREVDDSGKASYEQLIAHTGMAPDKLADSIMQSPEYCARRQSGQQLHRNDLDGYAVFCREGDALIGSHLTRGIPYEPWVMAAFDAALEQARVVLDVGANIGIFTMRAAHRLSGLGRVIAVEPLPQNLRALYAGIRYNGFTHVEVLPVAASDGPGLVAVSCEDDSSNGIVQIDGHEGGSVTLVPSHALGTLLSTLDRLDLVKIDIEGHEPIAWRGLIGLLQRLQPVVFLEFSPDAIRLNGHSDPEHFADQLLLYSPRIRVLHRDREAALCSTSAEIMAEWRAANDRVGLGGEMHIDLLLSGKH